MHRLTRSEPRVGLMFLDRGTKVVSKAATVRWRVTQPTGPQQPVQLPQTLTPGKKGPLPEPLGLIFLCRPERYRRPGPHLVRSGYPMAPILQ